MTSIPAMMTAFQNEWDSIMLETYSLKEKYSQVRQELSHALYQYDAACHVIARLTKERDAAREYVGGDCFRRKLSGVPLSDKEKECNQRLAEFCRALASVQAHVSTAPAAKEDGSTAMEVDVEPGLPADVVAKIDETLVKFVSLSFPVCHTFFVDLSQQRRKRKAPKDLTAPEVISKFTATKIIPSLHSASSPGITTMDYDPEKRFVVTGGADRAVGICSADGEKLVATLKGHTKKVHQVMWHTQDNDAGRAVFSASADKTVRMWTASESGGYRAAHIFKGHKGDVTGIGLHPSGDYLTSASLDSTWSLRDVATGKTLATAGKPEDNGAYFSCVYPRTYFRQTSKPRVYLTVRARTKPKFPGYTCCAVHPDGMIFCSGTSSDVVQIWDIKTRTNAASFAGHKGMVTAVAFSENGYLLATASADEPVVKLWDLRKLKTVQTLELGG
ncbi:MAG: WD40-repeat-containing domain protein, partial [Olpidium bornovanus]